MFPWASERIWGVWLSGQYASGLEITYQLFEHLHTLHHRSGHFHAFCFSFYHCKYGGLGDADESLLKACSWTNSKWT